MSEKTEQATLFEEETSKGPVTCLGFTFKNDAERREYFREELRKKLPELKKVEGFPIGEDEDILALSDPPFYTVCPNPWLDQIINNWSELEDNTNEYKREPFIADISEGKTDIIYKTHGYHTKVPHKAIMRYLLHYTNPGDVILDGFSGTGMTGVAAQMCGEEKVIKELGYSISEKGEVLDENNNIFSKVGVRKSVLSDLSPAAYFIASNFNKEINQRKLERAINSILSELEEECKWLYRTKHNGDSFGNVNYTVWSDVFYCPECNHELVFWDIAVKPSTQELKKEFKCLNCDSILNKRNLQRVWEPIYDISLKKVTEVAKQKLVSINYKYGSKRFEKAPDENDYELLKKIDEYHIDNWFPQDLLPDGYNTLQPKNSHGINHIHQFYTKRSLIVLSTFYKLVENHELRNELLMLLTGVAFSTTKLYRWTPNYEGGGPLSGTYYIPALLREISALDAINRFAKKVPKNLSFKKSYGNVCLSVSTATKLQLPNESIDYIFIDPPFGGNIMYSELNFLWESWLRVKTDNKSEAIMNDKQQKQLNEYQSLMTQSFENYYKVLKPGRWITVEFSNSQSSIWNAIREAMERAGFIIANVSALNKKQGSFKAITSTTAVKQDLVISAYKPKMENIEKMQKEINTEESSWTFVRQHLEQLPKFIGVKGEAQVIAERTPRILFDRMVAYHVQRGLPVPISSADFQIGIAQRFPMRDGMAFLEDQVAEYDKKRTLVKEFSQLSLFVSDENSAIEWIRQQLMNKPQTRQDLHPNFMREIQHIAKHELLPELDDLLEQNFLIYDGNEDVPSQIHGYLSSNYKDLRNLEKSDSRLKEKGKSRWYVPDPNKQADLEKLREKSLLREFESYKTEIEGNKKKLKQFRTEAIRTGFKKAWSEKDFETIVKVGERLPEKVIQEDDKLLMYFDQAQIRIGM
ncbi:DNA modification methylase [Cytobacillus eiseniae]|uniref:DNA modification methylase n=1 Tax=Cytobacillus eiseniae TaxID=762947 RepID=A0ABS4RI97_9BACI|nr:DNA methyltransferase [Cytobacillus eiseniae]MBP2242638.1 DNA modification methylase [Cytobacillus eiseniae]